MNKLLVLLLFLKVAFANVEIEKSINLTLEKKAQIDLELFRTDSDVKQLEDSIRQKRKILLQRARALAYLKDFKWGGLLSFDNPIAFERNLRILKGLNKYDLALFKDYKASLRNLAHGRAELNGYSIEFEKIIADLQNQELKLQDADTQRKAKLLTENKKSLLMFKGKLISPLDGQPKYSFGSYRDDQNEYAFLIRGLLFSPKTGEKIYASGPGRVIFRDQIPYWGETLIVQHEDDYFTVYAGVADSVKNVNDNVAQKEILANTNGADFYFELRHLDNPINPKTWLKEKL